MNKKANFNNEDFHRRTCRTRNEALEMGNIPEKFKIGLDEWLHIAAVREPVERFISGFVDKCLL